MPGPPLSDQSLKPNNRMHTSRRLALRFRVSGLFGRWIRCQRPLPAAVGEFDRWYHSRFMNYHTSLFVAALVASTLVGCSKHSTTTAVPKATDWGIIEVSDGVSSRHTLADGRVCTLTPTILPGGHQVQLATSITNMEAGGARYVFSLTTFFTPDTQTTFAFDPSNVISLTLHITK